MLTSNLLVVACANKGCYPNSYDPDFKSED